MQNFDSLTSCRLLEIIRRATWALKFLKSKLREISQSVVQVPRHPRISGWLLNVYFRILNCLDEGTRTSKAKLANSKYQGE